MNKNNAWESKEVFQPDGKSNPQQQISLKRISNAYQAPEVHVSEIKCFEVYLDSEGSIEYFCVLCGKPIKNNMKPVFHLRLHFNDNLSCKDWKEHFNIECGINSSSCNDIFNGLYDFINHLNNIHYNKENKQKRKNVEKMSCMYCNQKFDDPHERLKHITMNHLRDDMLNRNTSNDVVSTHPKENLIVDRFDKGPSNVEQANAEPNSFNDTYNMTKMVRAKLSNKRNKTQTTMHKSSTMFNKPDVTSSAISDINSNKDLLINVEPNDISKIKLECQSFKNRQDFVSNHVCEYCGKMFKSNRNLSVHINSAHTKINKFICSVCNKSFSHASYLKPHMRVHNDEKPYECKLCDKKFRVVGHLTSHMLRHNNIRRHPCTICDKKFFRSEELRSHLNVHSRVKPYTCDICDTNFRTTDALRSHRRLHTGEKPYECKVCGKKFPSMAGLYGHTRCNHRT